MLLDIDENPFVKHASLLQADHGAANVLQALVRHLFCAADWPCDVPRALRGYNQEIASIALEMQAWYAQYGEEDTVFLEVARDLVSRTIEAQERYRERQANGCQRASWDGEGVCGEPIDGVCDCGARLCEECAEESRNHKYKCNVFT